MNTLLFLVFAYIGGIIGIKLKLPAGALLGSMLSIGILQMTGLMTFTDVSPVIRIISKIALGTMIGLMFTREILQLPFKQLLSFLIVGLSSVASAILLGLIFHLFGTLPFITGLIASSPGGIAEMLTLADAIHADTQAVVIMHLIRFVTIMVLVRWLLNLNQKRGLPTS